MIEQVVILAGGLGTRLRAVIGETAKPMAPIADKPFLEYLLRMLRENGFTKFLLLVGYKGESILEYFQDGSKLGVKLTYALEDEPKGPGGALLNAWERLQDEFLLVPGDSFCDVAYTILQRFVSEKPVNALVVLRYSNDTSRYGFVEIDEEYKVKKFVEKGYLPADRVDGYINGGIYYFKKSVRKQFFENYNGEALSLETQILPALVAQTELYGLPMGGKFIDIGVAEDYWKAQKIIPSWLKAERKACLFIDRDGTIIEDPGYIHGEELNFKRDTIEIMRNAKGEGKLVIIITNQAGVAKGMFSEEESVKTTEAVVKHLAMNGITVDAYYYCPYHPDGSVEKYKKISLLRKPEPGMILRACEDFRIDLERSAVVGDNPKVDRIKLFGIGEFQIL
ncbi:HAD-IIIA family hydrolase [Pseudothermotoga sp.]|uniref:HAD-IIIA family hydrolase n=1 Tax=Pseudothermotoga sp. TaxID=2033661 RepID=UPI0031F6FE85